MIRPSPLADNGSLNPLIQLRQAAETARVRGDLRVAVSSYARALDLLPVSGAEKVAYELRFACAECLHDAGDYAAEAVQLEALKVLAAQLGELSRSVAVALRRALLLAVCGDPTSGQVLALATLEMARAADAPALVAECQLALADLSYQLSSYEQGRTMAQAALEGFRISGDQRGQAHALRQLGLNTLGASRLDVAEPLLLQSLELCRAIGDRQGEAQALNVLGIVSTDFAAARFLYELALAIAEALGLREIEATVANNLGIVYCALGLYGQAHVYAIRATELARAIRAQTLLACCLETLGRTRAGLGQLAEARAILIQGHALSEATGGRFGAAVCLVGLGRIALRQRRPHEAARLCAEAAAAFAGLGAPAEQATALAWHAAALLVVGQRANARAQSALATTVLADALASREFPAQSVWWWRAVTLTAQAGAEHERAAALERAAVAMLAPIATLSDAGLRRNYLWRHPVNRAIVAACPATLAASFNSPTNLQDQLTRLLGISARMNEIHDAALLHELFLDEVVELSGAERIVLLLQTGNGTIVLSRGVGSGALAGLQVAIEPVLATVMHRRRAMLCAGPAEPDTDTLAPGQPRSALVVPLISSARVLGALYADVRQRFGPFTATDRDLLGLLAVQASTALEHARLYDHALRAKDELQQLVSERTADLQAANVALEQRAAEAQAARVVAEAAAATKNIFLANVSHELRTPLNAVIGFTQLLARDPELSRRQRERVQLVTRSGEYLLALINDVLEMSRLEAGQLVLVPALFDLYQLLEELRELFHLRADGQQLEFAVQYGAQVPQMVVGDEARLRQVLINLLSNALKFTHNGSVVLRVTAVLEGEQVRVRVAVEDTGEGISAAELPTLFQPFVQTSSGRRTQEGSGLGLALSRQIARLMGGDIAVSSTLGVGSTFTCEVLLGRADNLVAEARQPGHGLVVAGRRFRVLVAHAERQSRRMIAAWLDAAGLQVREGAASSEALATLSEWRPHLVLVSASLREPSAAEIARQVRASPVGRSTVAIALDESDSDSASLLAAGYDAVLSGPPRQDDLLGVVAAQLGVALRYPALSADLAAGA